VSKSGLRSKSLIRWMELQYSKSRSEDIERKTVPPDMVERQK